MCTEGFSDGGGLLYLSYQDVVYKKLYLTLYVNKRGCEGSESLLVVMNASFQPAERRIKGTRLNP